VSNVKDTAEAIKGIVEAVPVYEDALQPAMKELSKGTLTIAKAINVALAPVSLLVWGFDQIKGYLETSLAKKLENIPSENIQPPDPSIAVPTIEALRYTGQKEELREMFSNLLANAMDKKTASATHPSFVEIIKQINSDEAKIINLLDSSKAHPIVKVKFVNQENDHFNELLKNFSLLPYQARCVHPQFGPSYLENIERLGLAEISYAHYVSLPNSYDSLIDHPVINKHRDYVASINKKFALDKGFFSRSNYGEKFYNTCIKER
jgi:hypothetical protein